MKKSNIILYRFLLEEKSLSLKQKIVLSQILYMIHRSKNKEVLLNIELKEKIKNLLKYHKDTINESIKKALSLGILDNNEEVYYIYNNQYNVDKKSIYISIPYNIFYNNDLTELDKIILAYCLGFKKNKNIDKLNCKMSNKQISEELNLSEQSVKRSISKLNTNGYIKLEHDKTGFIIKKRTIFVNVDNIENLYTKSIEKMEVENIENQVIKEVKEIHVNTIKMNYFEDSLDLLEMFNEITISTEDAKKLYFRKKKEYENAKKIYNKAMNIQPHGT